jgi:DNA-binding Xre family transcriptional regulator
MGLMVSRSRVKELMGKLGIDTQLELAQRADISEGTLVTMLKGGSFSRESLEKLARALECNPFDVLLTEGFPAPQHKAQAEYVPA